MLLNVKKFFRTMTAGKITVMLLNESDMKPFSPLI